MFIKRVATRDRHAGQVTEAPLGHGAEGRAESPHLRQEDTGLFMYVIIIIIIFFAIGSSKTQQID